MSLRRAGTLVIALALTACTEVTQVAQPTDLVFATFDSTSGVIPVPNDLVIQKAATAAPSASLPAAQIEVLQGYARSGGFPSDVEVKIDLPIRQMRWNTALNGGFGAYETVAAPSIDPASVTPATVALLKVDGGAVTPVAYEAVTTTAGKLTLRKPAVGTVRRWAGGRYVVAMRGGASGVKTTTGLPVNPDTAIQLAIQNVDLTNKENQPPGFPAALASQLNALTFTLWNKLTWQANASGAWTPGPAADVTAAFPAVDTAFPHGETAVLATFAIDKSAHVALDSAAGQVPFPSDFLLEQNVANCPTGVAPCIVNNPAFGPAAQGLRTLDGFSTTALLTATLTGPVDATSITWGNVHLFELTAGAPVRVKDLSLASGALPTAGGAGYVTQPPGTSANNLTTTMVLAPAVPADLTALGLGKFYLPPLKDKTRYAVVVTKRVKNADGTAMTRSAAGNVILSTTAPLYGPGPGGVEVPYVSGLDLATAKGLQQLRDGLAPLLNNLTAFTGGATTKDDVAMVYTISTQTEVKTAQDILAFAAGATPTATTILSPAQVGAEYGVDAAAAFPGGIVSEFAEVKFNTLNLLLSGRTQGAFDPGQPTPEAVTALVALPNPALVTGACPAGFPAASRCAPLVVFRHGLPRAKGDMLPIATRLAAEGFIVAAIDAEKHGDRTYCGGATQAAADQQCLNLAGSPASTCVADPKLKTSVDPGVVGRCSNGLLRARVDCASLFDAGGALIPACLSPKGIPAATGQFIISSNFFRSRDTFRQDVIDQAALVNALAPLAAPAPGADTFYDHLAGLNLAVNPDEIYFASLSMGSANAALSVAVNPRFKKAAFQSGFATITDVFFNPESKYYATATALLASFTPPVLPGTPEFLQFQQVAKWILDPADPANFGALIRAKAATMPVLSQIGRCDGTIPNTQSELFTALIGLPVPTPDIADTSTGFTQWFSNSGTTMACPDAKVEHGWLITPSTGTLMSQAQDAYASFLSTGAAQPTTVRP